MLLRSKPPRRRTGGSSSESGGFLYSSCWCSKMRFLSSGFRCAGKRAETKLEKFFGFFLHKAKLCATFASPNLRERQSQRASHDFGPTGRGGHVERVVPWDIELWCNGNTTDSGPVFPGSSPGSSTRRPVKHRLTGLHFLSDRAGFVPVCKEGSRLCCG